MAKAKSVSSVKHTHTHTHTQTLYDYLRSSFRRQLAGYPLYLRMRNSASRDLICLWEFLPSIHLLVQVIDLLAEMGGRRD